MILPERNRKDLQEVPAAILANMEVTISGLKMSEGSLLKTSFSCKKLLLNCVV